MPNRRCIAQPIKKAPGGVFTSPNSRCYSLGDLKEVSDYDGYDDVDVDDDDDDNEGAMLCATTERQTTAEA